MIHYTSDLHLGHANIIRHCSRPFTSVGEMDEKLIQNWNKKVHNDDTVYIVGDFIFRAPRKNVEEYLKALKGHKHLILGNHDRSWLKKLQNPEQYLDSIEPMLYITDKNHPVVLCHYPMMTWQSANRGGIMVYGHIHKNTHTAFWPLIARNSSMLNAGVDVNGFEPVSLEEMIENNNHFKEANTIIRERQD